MSGIITAAGISAAAGLAAGGMQMLNKSGGGGTQSQTTQQMIPPGWQQAATDNYDLAMQTANGLMGPYTGQRVAGMTPEQQALIAQMYGRVGSTDPAFATAMGATNGLMGFNPAMVNPQMLRDTNLTPYMNPYTQSVIDPALKSLEQSRLQSLNTIGQQATQAKAFGGSRQGVAEGTTNAQTAGQAGALSGQLWNQNWNQAQAAATGDITRDLTGQQSNQQYGLLGAQFRGQMANQYANLAQGQQNNWLTGVNAAMGGQGLLQQQQQNELDAAMKLYAEQRQQPLDVLKIRQNALSVSPYGQSSMQTGPGPSTDPWMTGLGTAATVAGLAGQFGRMKGWGSDTPTNKYSYPTAASTAAYPEFAPNMWRPS